jgi:hypothetical protein
MKEKQSTDAAWVGFRWGLNNFILHPSSFILKKSGGLNSFILHPPSFILARDAGAR